MKTNQPKIRKPITGNILVVLPKFIGDAVNCTPALQLIQKQYPNYKILLLVRPYLAELFGRETRYSIIIDERFHESQPISMLSQAKKLKSEHIELAIIMRSSLSEAVLCFLARIKYRIGYAKNGRTPLLTHSLKLNPNHHYIYRYCRLINEPHGDPFSTIPKTHLVKKHSDLIKQKNNKAIGVYFGGKNKKLRHYPHDFALESLKIIIKNTNCCFYLFGDPTEVEDVKQLHEQLMKQNIDSIMLAGKTSIATMVDAIGALDLMISIDSGPMHIAAALNIPIIPIVGLGTSPWSIVAPKTLNQLALVANGSQLIEDEIIKAIKPIDIANSVQKLLR
ncbi:glycosyltransferase family 9 protein [Pseudoalteromonas shioyasakiensis]|uniref:glycosyltransferase family 9 protein n=1 Tax=Pseudoalteromonas shioyasakiensis TaxID=1190813 RepID=UPI002118DDC3|nr:glycosyltransferase family 9 protein [Pseudoalteromonas shioyasakiensis]MCQ8879959.1 glycosyltransferase family 9 protein [Pseudoalteromonas shioyasakiensis]